MFGNRNLYFRPAKHARPYRTGELACFLFLQVISMLLGFDDDTLHEVAILPLLKIQIGCAPVPTASQDTFGQGACDPPPGRIRAVLFYQMAQVKQTDPMQIRRAKKDKSVPLDNRSLVGDGINQVNLPSTEKYTLSSFRPYR